MRVSDKVAVAAANVPLFFGAVFFAVVCVTGRRAEPPWLSPWQAASFVFFVFTPVLSIAAVWSAGRARACLLAIPAIAGCALQVEWLFYATRSLLYWVYLLPGHGDGPDLSGVFLLMYGLYFCCLVGNAVLMILRCATSRRPGNQGHHPMALR